MASRLNGLIAGDAKPWHLKATFKTFDDQGKPSDQGTIEESRLSRETFKRTVRYQGYSRTEYGSTKGILWTGDPARLTDEIATMRAGFVDPILDEEEIKHGSFARKDRELGGVKLSCVTITSAIPGQLAYLDAGITECFDAGSPVVRMSYFGLERLTVSYNNFVKFQDRFIARDLQVGSAGRVKLTAHLETLEALSQQDEATLTPPSDARPEPKQATVPADTAAELQNGKIKPVYPAIAQAAHITGTVTLQVLISTDGKVLSAHARTGPAMLQQAAIDAVKAITYQPYIVEGERLEVQTTVEVKFPPK